MKEPLIQMMNIVKRFPGVIANDRVNLDVYQGEIHAILGENGSGKSTLMSILAGLYKPTEGTMSVSGIERRFRSPRDAIACGIGMVHQHFKLVEPFSVTENLILGQRRGGFFVEKGKVAAEIRELANRYGLFVDPEAFIWQLSVGEKQRVEILRLLYQGSRVLILDEPTAVLTPQETCELFHNLRRMADDGCAILFITHKLNEVESLADRVTVLRGGKVVGSQVRAELARKALVNMMVGKELQVQPVRKSAVIGENVLQLTNVSALNDMGRKGLDGLSLSIRSGEIYGLAGVAGNGQRDLAEVIAGLRGMTEGEYFLQGAPARGLTPRELIERGVSYVPEDRLGMGLVPELNAVENLMLKDYKKDDFGSCWLMDYPKIQLWATDLVREYDVKLSSLMQPVKLMSGGNLQKLLLAREITRQPKLMVVLYPVRGLDIGAIEAVHRLLIGLRESGAAILLVSEELEEIAKLSDRVGVLFGGRIVGEFIADALDLEQVGLLMAGAGIQAGGDDCALSC